MCADFNYYLNRQGAPGLQGEKGDKGDKGDSITVSTGVNTPTEYTLIFDKGDGNSFETGNLKYPMRDDGGSYLRYDRTNNTVVLGYPNIAELNGNSGEVQLATTVTVGNNTVQNKDAVSYELFKSVKDSTDSELTSLDGRVTYLEQHGGGGGGGTTFTPGAGLNMTPENILYVETDSTITIDQETNELGVLYGAGLDKDSDNGVLTTKVDGTTITYDNDGALTAIGGGGTPANMVTTDTNQTITGLKTFTDSLGFPGVTLTNIGNRIRANDPTNQSSFGNLAYSTDIGDGTITLTQGTTTLGTFSVNQSGNTSINIPASGGGGGTSYAAGDGIDISGSDVISAKVDGTTIGIDSSTKEIKLLSSIPTDTSDLTNGAGYITGITSGDVTSALGYTPYSSSNPNGYTSNVGTVTSVNNNNPDSNGNVTLSIPDTTNLVTTNTTQTISGSKTFSTETHHQGVITFDSALGTPIIRGTSGSNYRNMITRSNTYSTVTTGNTSDNLILKGALTRPKYSHDSSDGNYLALYSDIPGDMTGAGASTAGTKGLVPAPAAGDNEKFLRGDGTWQTVSGGGSIDAYTKAETDNLLKSKISGDSVDNPLEYTSPMDGYATLANFPSGSTIANTVSDNPSYSYGGSGYTPNLYIYSTSLSSYKNINSTDFATACNEQPYIEIELTNGLNFAYKLRNYNSVYGDYSWFGIVGGKYSGTTFIPTFTIQTTDGSGSGVEPAVIDFGSSHIYGVGGQWNDYQNFEDFAMSVYYDSTSEHLYTGVSNISHNTGAFSETTNLDSSSKQLLLDTTHIRVYTILKYSSTPSPTNGNGILDLSQTRFVNPDPNDNKVAYTGMNNEARYNVYINGTNLMIQSVQEQLTLKYDPSTLGVNSNNELYVISDNAKADTDLSNLSNTGKVAITSMEDCSSTTVAFTPPATEQSVTFNSSGIISWILDGTNAHYAILHCKRPISWFATTTATDVWLSTRVDKGESVQFYYNNITFRYPTFTFLKGSESEGT